MIGAITHLIHHAIVEFRAEDRLPDMIEVYHEVCILCAGEEDVTSTAPTKTAKASTLLWSQKSSWDFL
jgi:hypothetical protein